jgi:HAE1 family hydrophobic/amphiphilic exporter-1
VGSRKGAFREPRSEPRWLRHPLVRRTAAVCSIGLLTAVSLQAQEPTPTGTVSLSVDEAVERALSANERARIARAQVDRTAGIVREAFARALPTIDGSYRLTRNLQRPVIFFNQEGEIQQITIGDQHEHAFELSVEQPVFDRGLGAALSAARHGNRASEEIYERTLTDVSLGAREAYYRVLRARAQVTVREGALRLLEARLRQVRLFLDVGTAAEFDVLTAEVAVENERPALILARNEQDLARNGLNRSIALPLDVEVELEDSLAYVPEMIGLEQAIEHALISRPDLLAQQQSVELADELVKVERAEGFPTLNLNLDVSRVASSSDVIPEDRDFSQAASAGIFLDIPVFDGRRTQGRVLQARADAVAAEETLRGLERDIRLEVQDAWQSVQAAAEQVEATRATVGLARRAYDIGLVRFRSGLSTQLELDEVEQDVITAESNAADALYLHMVARARLRHAMGER